MVCNWLPKNKTCYISRPLEVWRQPRFLFLMPCSYNSRCLEKNGIYQYVSRSLTPWTPKLTDAAHPTLPAPPPLGWPRFTADLKAKSWTFTTLFTLPETSKLKKNGNRRALTSDGGSLPWEKQRLEPSCLLFFVRWANYSLNSQLSPHSNLKSGQFPFLA